MACGLADQWLTRDFLLSDKMAALISSLVTLHISGRTDLAIAFRVPSSLSDDIRADIYIPFIERAFLLNQGGNLGFICRDRWMKTAMAVR